jgi:hypothetical protein
MLATTFLKRVKRCHFATASMEQWVQQRRMETAPYRCKNKGSESANVLAAHLMQPHTKDPASSFLCKEEAMDRQHRAAMNQ